MWFVPLHPSPHCGHFPTGLFNHPSHYSSSASMQTHTTLKILRDHLSVQHQQCQWPYSLCLLCSPHADLPGLHRWFSPSWGLLCVSSTMGRVLEGRGCSCNFTLSHWVIPFSRRVSWSCFLVTSPRHSYPKPSLKIHLCRILLLVFQHTGSTQASDSVRKVIIAGVHFSSCVLQCW